MDLFVLDTAGDSQLFDKKAKKYKKSAIISDSSRQTLEKAESEASEDEADYGGLPPPSKDISGIIKKALASFPTKPKKSKTEVDYEKFADSMGWTSKANQPATSGRQASQVLLSNDDDLTRPNLDEFLGNSALKAVEKKESIPNPSARQSAKLKKAEREKTKGKDWFNMPAPELTEEIENDLKILQMRSVLNPKHFYKRNAFKTLPKYFQIGTVQHSPLDHFSERGERRNKKRSLVEELMADAEFQQFNKRKFKEVMAKRQRNGYHKANQKMKKLKKKKK